MDSRKQYDIAMIGHFAKDRIIALGKERTSAGGAVYYGSIPVSNIGFKVAVITRVADSDIEMIKPMEEYGVDVFPIASDVTSGIENRYIDETLERRECTPLAFAGAYDYEDFPEIESKIWHIGSLIKGEVDFDLLEKISALGRLSADAQGFVRAMKNGKLEYEDWKEKIDALPLIEFLKCDAAEAEILTGLSDIKEAATKLKSWGAKEIVLTHPGGLMIHYEDKFFNTKFNPSVVRGRTGRGDTCISSYVAWRLEHDPEESCRFAAALCSLKMENEGPYTGTVEQVIEKMGSK